MQEKAVDLASAAATKDGTQAAPDPAPGTGEGAASKVAIVLESDEAVASSSCGRLMGHITRARDLLTAIGFYVICSSSMSLINKVAVVFYPFPNFLLLLQTASGAALPFLGKQLGLVAVDSLERGKIVSFLPCATFYFLGIYTGMHATATMNLDTIIWFRSTLPIGVALGEAMFLDRELPSLRALLGICIILASALLFAASADPHEFNTVSMLWASAYWVSLLIGQLVMTHVVSDKGPRLTDWGRVFYNNALSLPLFSLLTLRSVPRIADYNASWLAFWAIIASCIIGCFINYAGFRLRTFVSATSFTVINLLNKNLTVIANLLIWNQHSAPISTVWLFFSFVGGALYQESGKRSAK